MYNTDYLYRHGPNMSWFVEEDVLYIPGTNQVTDWLTNVDVWLDSGVHRGFLRVYKKLLKEIDLNSVHTVHGHSLGGALTVLLAWKFPHLQCYTYGSPRVFRRPMELSNLTQYNFWWDPVPDLPMWLHHGSTQIPTEFAYLNPHKYLLHV